MSIIFSFIPILNHLRNPRNKKGSIEIKELSMSSMMAFFFAAQILFCTILAIITNSVTCQGDQIMTKKFMEPCEFTYSQAHCQDDEDETEEECILQKSDDCDRSLELYCGTRLVCWPKCHPLIENYDHVEGKCYRKIGADCRTSLECEKNAVCDRRKCQCFPSFSVDPETGKCARAAGYGEFCNSEINCDIMSDIDCKNGTCECKSAENQFYNPRRKRCYVNIGHKCSHGLQFCPDNSNCVREIPRNESLIGDNDEVEEEPYIGIGIYEDEGKVFKCKCEKGHGPTEDGKSCLGLFGSSCNSLHKCQTERSLKCYSGTCRCAEARIQYYDRKAQTCKFIELVGMPCDSDDSCVEYAKCKPQGGSISIRKCGCGSGFLPTAEGYCLKGHGQNCSALNDESPPCNSFAGLECSNDTGTCQCMDQGQFYDLKLHECRNFEIAPRNREFTYSDREYTFGVIGLGSVNRVSNLYQVIVIGISRFFA